MSVNRELLEYLARELQRDLLTELGREERPGKPREIIARLLGFRTQAALLDVFNSSNDGHFAPERIDIDAAVQRARELLGGADENFDEVVTASLERASVIVSVPDEALAARLLVALEDTATWHHEVMQSSGYILLRREDLEDCLLLTDRDSFRDRLFTGSPRDTFQYLFAALEDRHPQDGLHRCFPDVALNVASYLIGTQRVFEFVLKYMCREDGQRAYLNGQVNPRPMFHVGPSERRQLL